MAGEISSGSRDRRRISDLLIALVGAQRSVLNRFPGDRPKYVGTGGVILGTSVIAGLSLAFAMRIALDASLPVCAVLGFGWGLFIANLDRWLVSFPRQETFWQNVGYLVPRLCLAVVISVVISTPLVLTIFDDEVRAKVTEIQSEREAEFLADRRTDPTGLRIADLRAEIAGLAEDVEAASQTPDASELRQTTKNLEDDLTSIDNQITAAKTELSDEISGRGRTGAPGKGDTAASIQSKIDQLVANRTEKKAELDKARSAETAADGVRTRGRPASITTAEDKKELARLEADEARNVAEFQARNTNNDGMLIRLDALHKITFSSGSGFAAHGAVAALALLIECLPIFIKFLMSLGKESAYETTAAADEATVLHEAGLRRKLREEIAGRDAEKELFLAELDHDLELDRAQRWSERLREVYSQVDAAHADEIRRRLTQEVQADPFRPHDGDHQGAPRPRRLAETDGGPGPGPRTEAVARRKEASRRPWPVLAGWRGRISGPPHPNGSGGSGGSGEDVPPEDPAASGGPPKDLGSA
ncbi:hypothetical protein ACG83_25710 [Frankia sp. R43]|uniref:DUF4407 domain-containing protein n=1 Tax=Frankia sp. R43 TaxID=269536 RepID=UPI0006CA2BFB|nr:DUF4407 domain-containing protein [Frankia sp. R43]KPM52841.1 hypothetical protein ACG83_25710 [Frankia sp. R43]